MNILLKHLKKSDFQSHFSVLKIGGIFVKKSLKNIGPEDQLFWKKVFKIFYFLSKGWFDEFDSNIRGPRAPHIEFSTIA